MTNSVFKKPNKLFAIPTSPNESDETDSFVFKIDLPQRRNFRKFVVLGNNKSGNEKEIAEEGRQFKTDIGLHDINSSSDVIEIFNNRKQKPNHNSKLDFNYFSLSLNTDGNGSEDGKNTIEDSLNYSFPNIHGKGCNNEDNKSVFQRKSIESSSETFGIKRRLWPRSSSNKKFRSTSTPECHTINCSIVENVSFKPDLIKRKINNSNYTNKILELKKDFHSLVKQLKFCETDEDKCFMQKNSKLLTVNFQHFSIIKIVFCYLKGSFSHLCDRIVPKIILMIKDMYRNQGSKHYCSILIFALIKAKLVSNISDILSLIISLMKTDALIPSDKQQCKKIEVKSEKQLSILKCVEENENLEVISQYSTTDFALDCVLKFSAYSKTDTYKSELRHMGGLDVILDIVNSQSATIWNEQLSSEIQLYNIIKLEHCLNILQNVIFRIPENQSFVLNYKNFQVLQNLSSVLHFIQQKFIHKSFKKVSSINYLQCLSSALKLLTNITYKNVQGSIHIEGHGEIINILLFFLTTLSSLNQEVDVILLCLELIANLVMTSKENLHKFTATKVKCSRFQNELSSLVALSEMFQSLHLKLQKLEADTELLYVTSFLNSDRVKGFEDNESAVFHSAGHHMEHSMICAFLALILGFAIQDNKENAYIIKGALPNTQFDGMALVLKEFHDFIAQTDLLENIHLQEIQSIVDILFSL